MNAQAHSIARQMTCGGCAYLLLKNHGKAICRFTGSSLYPDQVRCESWSEVAPGISAGQDLTINRSFKTPLLGKNGTRRSDLVFGGQ